MPVAAGPLRSLIVAENLPFPAFKGGDLRTWQNVNALCELGPVAVFGLCSKDRRAATPPRDGIRAWRTSADAALAFDESPPAAPGRRTPRPWWLSADAHPADCYYSVGAEAELMVLGKEFEPDLVVVERLWLHSYVGSLRGLGCPIVLDNHNVEAELYRQLAAADSATLPRALRAALWRRTEQLERNAVHSVDEIWVCSDHDAHLMTSAYRPKAAVRVVPNGIDVASYAPPAAGRDTQTPQPRRFIFPAMFGYAPNAAAARFLLEAVLPLCRCPEAELLLVGGMPTELMRCAAREDPRITVTGAVPDMRPWLATSTAMLVPLFEGSGTRFKLLESFAARVPVVTTARGAEGLGVAHEREVLIAETAEEFAAAAERLATDAALAERLTRAAFELVQIHYSWNTLLPRIAATALDLVRADA